MCIFEPDSRRKVSDLERRERLREEIERVLGRRPNPAEAGACRQFLADLTGELAGGRLTFFDGGDTPQTKAADDAHLRARENLVLVLFNHNDFISVR